MEYFLSIILGALSGLIFGFLFIQNDRQWINTTFFFGGNTGLIFGVCKLLEFFDIPKNKHIYHVSTFLIIMIIFMIALILFLTSKILKDTAKQALHITLTDILLGNKKVFMDYYQRRKNQVDHDLNVTELEEKSKNLIELEKSISTREKLIQENEDRLQNTIQNRVFLEVPIKSKFFVDNAFLSELPEYLKHFANFSQGLNDITSDFIMELSEKQKEVTDKNLVKSYFNMISAYFLGAFFGGMDSRAHFRVLNER